LFLYVVILLAHGWVGRPGLASSFLILDCASAQLRFSPFMGEYLFFAWPKKRHQKKGHPTVLACGVSVRFSLERALRNSLRSDSPRAEPL